MATAHLSGADPQMGLTGRSLPPKTKLWEHRTIPPEATLARLEPVWERVGITRVADITDLDRIGIPVFQAVRPMGLSLSMSQGKASSKEAARVSAIMESIEMWHAETEDLPGILASASGLDGKRFLDPNCLRITSFDGSVGDGPMTWTEATDLEDGASVLVPRDAANMDFTRAASPPWLLRSTNGLAGGNTPAEALSSAIAEAIERFCMSAFDEAGTHYKAMRRIDPGMLASDNRRISCLVEPIRNAGLELELFDMTNHLDVTAIKAIIYDISPGGQVPRPAVGHGAHLDPVTAVTRAITEAAQSRLTYISGNRDDLDPANYRNSHLSNLARVLDRGMDFSGARHGLDLTDQSGDSPEADFTIMLRRILDSNLGPVIAIDLTNAELGIPVMKILAPSLVCPGPGAKPLSKSDRP